MSVTRIKRKRAFSERDMAQMILGDFRVGGSNAERLLSSLMSDCSAVDFTRDSLRSLCLMFSSLTGIYLSRNMKRGKQVLMKWIDDNYDAIMAAIQRFNVQVECHDMPGCEAEDEMVPDVMEPNENTPTSITSARDGFFGAECFDWQPEWDFNCDEDCYPGYYI